MDVDLKGVVPAVNKNYCVAIWTNSKDWGVGCEESGMLKELEI
jgi:hypothetical protein